MKRYIMRKGRQYFSRLMLPENGGKAVQKYTPYRYDAAAVADMNMAIKCARRLGCDTVESFDPATGKGEVVWSYTSAAR